jgi:citrate lyase subunit beta/citryl-CoA lyase
VPAQCLHAQEAGVMSAAAPSLERLPRSLLFVPASEERKLAKGMGSGADLLIVDLEDSVALNAKPAARDLAAGFLRSHAGDQQRPLLYVRVNAYDTGLTADDLAAVLPARPDGIVLPKAGSGADALRLSTDLDRLEREAGISTGATGIIVIATETPAAVLQLHSFAGSTPRLKGLTWGAEDLSAAIGASAARDATGGFTGPFALARNLCLFAAHAAGVQAIDGIQADFRDTDALEREAREAARDGFTAKLAIHPAQVPLINAAFTPSESQIAEARAIVDAFAAAGGAGVIAMDGRMLDKPHLEKALRILARAR